MKNREEKVMFSLFCQSVVRAIRLMRKLYDVTLIHIFLMLENQVRGNNMMDGRIIFSIEVDLGFVRSLCRRY